MPLHLPCEHSVDVKCAIILTILYKKIFEFIRIFALALKQRKCEFECQRSRDPGAYSIGRGKFPLVIAIDSE